MHGDLVRMFRQLEEILKKDERLRGGWYYGSCGRNTQDIYSDYDVVFLVGDADVSGFIEELPELLKRVCDELLIFWGEGFNDHSFQNYCSIIRLGKNLHQFDVFVANAAYPESFLCRLHCMGCGEEQLIFDREGETALFLKNSEEIPAEAGDPVRAMDTYWFHVQMLVKYFKRRDLFKLLKNIDILFHTHGDLLLSVHGGQSPGAWESRVKQYLSPEKQDHLKAYFTAADFAEMETMLRKMIGVFRADAEEVCREKGIDYPEDISQKVISFFNGRLDCQDEAEAGWA